MYRAHGGAHLGAHRLDGLEIMGTHEVGGCPGHDGLVQMLGIEPYPVHQKGVADTGVVDAVSVLLFQAGADGVERAAYLAGPDHHDILGQAGIHRQGQPVAGDAGAGMEVGDIGFGMDAGVGAACPGAFDRMAHHLCQSFFQRLLHRDGVFLDLPAVVGGAYIHQS